MVFIVYTIPVNILIANVGNVRFNEVKALSEALNKQHKVTLVTMAAESSHRGVAFSFLDTPVRAAPLLYKDVINSTEWVAQGEGTLKNASKKKLEAFDGITAYEFAANPADAISVMLAEILQHEKPDLVICGINNGIHMGQDVYSSSSVGMAFEAAFFRVPTICVAVEHRVGGHSHAELGNAVTFIEKNVEKFAKMHLPEHTFLNINIPTVKAYKDFKGVRIARMGRLVQLSRYVEHVDSCGQKYYWADYAERLNANIGDEQFARTWYDRGYITVTPVSYDATDYDAVEGWNKGVIRALKTEAAQ